jgi:hypothetical protein
VGPNSALGELNQRPHNIARYTPTTFYHRLSPAPGVRNVRPVNALTIRSPGFPTTFYHGFPVPSQNTHVVVGDFDTKEQALILESIEEKLVHLEWLRLRCYQNFSFTARSIEGRLSR